METMKTARASHDTVKNDKRRSTQRQQAWQFLREIQSARSLAMKLRRTRHGLVRSEGSGAQRRAQIDGAYFRQRLHEERTAARNAVCAHARRVHEVLAAAYARRCADLAAARPIWTLQCRARQE